MNIFEILDKNGLAPAVEFKRLITLFNESRYFDDEEELDFLFRFLLEDFWPHLPLQIRRTSLNFDDLLKDLKLDEKHRNPIDWDKLFLLCELLKNVINSAAPYLDKKSEGARNIAQHILSNIDFILEKSNHKWAKIKDGYIIIKKNAATTEAIDSLEPGNETLAISMLEYDRVLLKGNLQRKSEILANMANYVEPWKKEFKESIYYTLYTDARELVNNLDIRHNNSGKGETPNYAKNWTPNEYEERYDKTFHTLLMVILAKKQLEIKKDLNKLKKDCTQP